MRCNDFGAGHDWEDPIVKEIHEIREQMAAECGYDIRAFVASIKKLENEDRRLGAVFVDERTNAAPMWRAQQKPDAA